MAPSSPRISRTDFGILLLAALGLLVTVWLFPQTYPQASLQGSLSRREITQHAERMLAQIESSGIGLEPVIDFRANQSLLAFGQVNFGATEANRLFRENLPAFFWNVRYGKPPLLKNILNSGASEEKLADFFEKHMVGEARLQIDTRGRLMTYDTFAEHPHDSTRLSPAAAQALALRLMPFSTINDTAGIVLEKSQITEQKTRLDHSFVWRVPAPMWG